MIANPDGLGMPAIAPLLVLEVQTAPPRHIGRTPLGAHSIFDVLGGRFEGPGLSGTVPASGGDWVTRTSAGSRLNVRLVLETDDGVALLLRYTGRASQRDGRPHIEILASFEAPEGPCSWLNHIQAFGLGEVTEVGVRYRLYRFS